MQLDVSTQATVTFAAITFGSYFLGSIPFGLVLTKLAGKGDIRKMGSGNIGATNVLRTGNRFLAFMTLALDMGKGIAAVLLTDRIEPNLALLAGVFCLLGHLFPVWLKFNGGKGVATTVGVLLAINMPVGVTVAISWMLVAYLSRFSSLAAIVSIGLAPLDLMLSHREDLLWLAVCMSMLVIIKHRANIKRLRAGKEPKIGQK